MKKVATIEGKGTGTYVSDTGRFEDIKGNAEFEAEHPTPYVPDRGSRSDMIVKGVPD